MSRYVLVFFLLLGSTVITHGQAVAVPSNFFGVSVFSSSSYPLGGGIVVGTEGKVGGITIAGIEPTCDGGTNQASGCYDWTIMDAWVALAQTNGWTLVYDWDSTPYWMCGNATGVRCTVIPTNLAYVTHVIGTIATRYKGKIKYYETYNEANTVTEWTDTCANLVLLDNTEYAAIKAADPSAIVGGPNMGYGGNTICGGSTAHEWLWTQGFLATTDINGHLPSVDTVGEHMYNRNVPPLDTVGQNLLTLYNNFRSVMTAAGIPTTQPLLVTEGSFGADSQSTACSAPLNTTACLSASDQLAYIGRWLVLLASTWSDGGGTLPSWYAYDLNYGTLNGTLGMNPQNASAYGEMESWIKGGLFASQCSVSGTLNLCPFTMNGTNEEIVFNDNAGASTNYTVPGWATNYQPLQGTQSAISGGIVSVGNMPILLTGSGTPTGVVIPSAAWSARTIDWTQVGIPGGIPDANWPICATIPPSGGADDSATIQASLNSCAAGSVVLLTAGTYTLHRSGIVCPGKSDDGSQGVYESGLCVTDKSIALRGAGPQSTVLNYSDGANIVSMGTTFLSHSSITFTPITSSATKGATSITVSSVPSGVVANSYIVISQTNPNDTDSNPLVEIGGYDGSCTYCGHDLPNNAMDQIDEVTAVSGTTLTLARPLYYNYTNAPVMYHLPMISSVGLENLRVVGTSASGTGLVYKNVNMEACAHCWIHNVESDWAVDVANFYLSDVYGSEVSNNYGYQSFNHNGGAGYGITLYFRVSETLIANNILRLIRHSLPTIGTSGNVYAYNYGVNNYEGESHNFLPETQFHGPQAYMSLFEGNVLSNTEFGDFTHGSGGNDNTMFRSNLNMTSLNPDNGQQTTSGMIALNVAYYSNYTNIVGNALGNFTGTCLASTYETDSPTTKVNKVLWQIGYYDDGGSASPNASLSAKVGNTMVRGGNWDCVSKTTVWSNNIPSGGFSASYMASQTLPNSLFLSAAPSYFTATGAVWPPINTAASTVVNQIPAQICYNKAGGPNSSLGGNFNPTSCYTQTSSTCGGSSPTWTANSTSNANISACITVASSGDTILVPSGTASFSSAVSIPNTKCLTINGQGATVTNSPAFIINQGSSCESRVTGFNFTGTSSNQPNTDIVVNLGTAAGRVDHNTFTAPATNIFMEINGIGEPFLVDHNTFNCGYVIGSSACEAIHNDGAGCCAETGWTNDVTPGGSNMVFIELNTFNNTSASGNVYSALESFFGAQTVFRDNTLNNSVQVDQHGTAGYVGARWWEIYNNQFNANHYNQCCFITIRGGSGVIWGNQTDGTTTGGPSSQFIDLYCENAGTWPTEWCPGSGYGGDTTPHAACPGPTNNAPAQLWGNSANLPVGTQTPTLTLLNRDYFVSTTQPSNIHWVETSTDTCSTTYTYTPYTYPHPLDTGAGVITISPASLAFGAVLQGHAATPLTAVINNASGTTIVLAPPSITGTNAGDFSSTGCTSGTLTNGSTCTVTVNFTPTGSPVLAETASMMINYSGFAGPPVTLTLTGTSGNSTAPAAPTGLGNTVN